MDSKERHLGTSFQIIKSIKYVFVTNFEYSGRSTSARSGSEHASDNFGYSGFGDWAFGEKEFGGRGLMESAAACLLGLDP